MIDYKNPWVLGGAGLLLVVILMRSGGGGGDTSLGVASQNVATGANVQLAGMSTALQGQALEINAARDVSILGLSLGWLAKNSDTMLAQQELASAVDVHKNDNTTLFKLTSVNNATYEKIAPALANIAAANAQALANISAQTAMTINGQNINAQMSWANLQAGQQNANRNANLVSNAGGILGGLGSGIGSILGAFGL